MNRLALPARAAAAAALRRMSSAAEGSSSSSSSSSSNTNSTMNINLKDARPQETFFGMPPPGSDATTHFVDATTHFGFQTVAQELKEGLVAQVPRCSLGRLLFITILKL
jgi:hypothetical protein